MDYEISKFITISIHLFYSQIDLLALFYLVSNLWTSSNHIACLKVLELKSRVASVVSWNLLDRPLCHRSCL